MRSRMSGISGRMSSTWGPSFLLAPANSRLPTRIPVGIDVVDVLASVGTSSDIAAGADRGVLRIEADREEEPSDRLVLRDPLPEFDWVLARTIMSPQKSITPATASHAQV
jgi:hypothetical protein